MKVRVIIGFAALVCAAAIIWSGILVRGPLGWGQP